LNHKLPLADADSTLEDIIELELHEILEEFVDLDDSAVSKHNELVVFLAEVGSAEEAGIVEFSVEKVLLADSKGGSFEHIAAVCSDQVDFVELFEHLGQ
jgi:hypothetical protein